MQMHPTFVLIFALTVAITVDGLKLRGVQSCTKIDTCSCRTDQGEVISLKDYALPENQKYETISSFSGNYFFRYNPCQEFTEGGHTGYIQRVHKESGAVDKVGVNVDFTVAYPGMEGYAVQSISTSDNSFKFDIILQCWRGGAEPTYVRYEGTNKVQFHLRSAAVCAEESP